MAKINLIGQLKTEYLKFETDLLYKVRIGVLTEAEAATLIEAWFDARGINETNSSI